MDWNELVDLVLNSIQIIGVFIAIIIGLVISRAMEMKQESSELSDALEDAKCEIINCEQYLDKLEKENDEYYRYNYAGDITRAILRGESSALFDVPYVNSKRQTEFYNFVQECVSKIKNDVVSGMDSDECKHRNAVAPGSVEEVIVNAACGWYAENRAYNKDDVYDGLLSIPSTITAINFLPEYIPSTGETMRNNIVVHEIDRVKCEVSIKRQQCDMYNRRINSISGAINVRHGLVISLGVVIFSVIIPFLAVAFQGSLVNYASIVFVYIVVSFIASMAAMCLFLVWFCADRRS